MYGQKVGGHDVTNTRYLQGSAAVSRWFTSACYASKTRKYIYHHQYSAETLKIHS